MNIVCWLQNKKGYTLIEILLVLSLCLLIVSFFPTFILTLIKGYQTDKITFQQVTMFFNQLAQDIRVASNVELGQGTLVLRKHEEKDIEVKLSTSGQLRRTSDGEGNVLLLEEVQTFSCSSYKQVVNCKVVLKSKDSFTKSFLLPFGKVVGP